MHKVERVTDSNRAGIEWWCRCGEGGKREARGRGDWLKRVNYIPRAELPAHVGSGSIPSCSLGTICMHAVREQSEPRTGLPVYWNMY